MFKVSTRDKLQKPSPILAFPGQRQPGGGNILNMPLGTLIYNKNMEYMYSTNRVFLRTKRGSRCTKDILVSTKGAANYCYNNDTNFHIFVGIDGILKSLDENASTITSVKTGLSAAYRHSFLMFGLATNAALFGTNLTDGLYKISGSTPSWAAVANAPAMSMICFSAISGRMIGINGPRVYYSKVQQLDATTTTNLEDFGYTGPNTWTQFATPSPDSGTGFKACIDTGETVVLLKDSGVWLLPNAEEDPTNWVFPKARADVGTKSPDTVKLARLGKTIVGVIYLATDKTLRFLTVNITRNAGTTPSIDGGDASVISDTFQNILDKIPEAHLNKCTGSYKDGYYILNILQGNETELSTTLIIDMQKMITEGEDTPQPYWFISENMEYLDFTIRPKDNKWFGFHKKGYISELFVNDLYSEGVPARIDASGKIKINWKIYTAWHKYSDYELELRGGYLFWAVEGRWKINFYANAFKIGEAIPQYDEGLTQVLNPAEVSGASYFDISRFGIGRFSSSEGQLSQNMNTDLHGNYFLFGASNNGDTGEWATIYGIEPIFAQVRASVRAIRG